jgi:hypothetical protein
MSAKFAPPVSDGNIIAGLILDGLRSHSTAYTPDAFRNEQIRVIELPPHSTHLYQPLDLCLFGIMKNEYQGSLRKFIQNLP